MGENKLHYGNKHGSEIALNKEISETRRNTVGDVSWTFVVFLVVAERPREIFLCMAFSPLFRLGLLQFSCSSYRLVPDRWCVETPGELPQQPLEMLRVLQRNTGRASPTAVRSVSCIN
jgi:hypothetical protein